MSSVFSSKILLFGEYSVIRNSMALAIPFPLFEGVLRFSAKGGIFTPDKNMISFINYLKQFPLPFPFDLPTFELDVNKGLFFDSSIPQGFGAGSSGALCAALYDRYVCPVKDNTEGIEELKKRFSLMESHFHGTSSGLDPLISYLGHGLVLSEDQSLNRADIPDYKLGNKGIFILDTGESRKTEPLVNLFLEKLNNKHFRNMIEKVLLPVNNYCIKLFLSKRTELLYQTFKKLSVLQNEYFSPMIPQLLRSIWKEGIDNDDYYLKLCGAGGGGFILGITQDFEKIQQTLSPYVVRPLYRFS